MVVQRTRVEEFERRFAALFGGGVQAVALNSATAGLHLALEALGIGPGAEVLVPTWTFSATAEVVVHLGARVVFVDSDPVTLNLDLADAERKVTGNTRAVLPVHFAGRAMSPSQLHDFTARHHLHAVEDAAHAFPSASEGIPVGGGHSAATVFSFYATKTITTGEGGMLVTRDSGLANRVRMTRLHGIDRNAFDRYRSDRPAWRYNIAAAGYKYNLTDTAAAIGLVQLDRAEKMHLRRERIAERYRAAFADLPLDLPLEAPVGDVHSWHLFVVRLWPDASLGRNEFIAEMSRRGVCCSVHFIPLHMHSYWRERYGLRDEMFPVASSEFDRVVSIPLYSGMTDEDVDRVVGTVHDVLR